MTRILGAIFALIILFSANAAHAVCSSPAGAAGSIIYNDSQNIFQYCNDTNWLRMNISPGTGSGGCTNPTLAEGQMVYNADHRVLQGCAGNVHRPFTPPGSSGNGVSWRMIAMGGDSASAHACGIKTDNTMWCWGSNGAGQLGDNTTAAKSIHTQINGGGSWKFVATGGSHSCGIKQDNTLWCWGHNGSWNNWGQLGDGTTTQRNVPTAVSGGGTWKYVAGGWSHTCGIKADDTLWCWGNNANGKTGHNTTVGNTLTATQVNGGGTWKKVALGTTHTCGIRTDDTMYCWGSNANGRTGRNTGAGNTLVPTQIDGGSTWEDITAGEAHSCGIRSDDTMRCWGNNWVGMLGDNTQTERLVPTAINGGGTWKQVSATHAQHTCAVRSDDTVRCWGFNNDGQGGNGLYNAYNLVQTAATDTGPWRQISVGAVSSNGFTCGIKIDGSLRCWGGNREGQHGNNTVSFVTTPMPASASGAWKQVTTGESGSTCAIRVDDTVWCWGENASVQLGLGNNTARILTPTQISGGGTWSKIAMNDLHACGIKTDQSLWCWGSNFAGQVGDSTQFNSYNVPTAVSGGGTWKDIAAGGSSATGVTCGIKTDDTLWCWGDNASGRTGLNTSSGQQLVPAQVASGTFWKKISVGQNHSCGIRTNDSLYCWGSNSSGQVGDNSPGTDRLVPTAVTGGGTWKYVAASMGFTCAVRLSDDAMLCWGSNNSGNIGDNSTTQRDIPTAVNGGGSWNLVDGAAYAWGAFNCGTRTDGSAWCWGAGSTGNLGNGSYTQYTVPTAVSGGHIWKDISAGGSNAQAYACGIRSDDSLWCWGSNTSGQLTQTATSTASLGTSVMTWCADPTGSTGSIKFNSAVNLLQFCDGVGWVGIRGGTYTPQPEGIPTSGLVGYWAFNEGSGTSASDSSGNGNTGTLGNGPTWVTGRVGAYAINFDGTNDQIIVPHAAELSLSSSHSISVWVNPTTLPGSYITLVHKGNNYAVETIGDEILGSFYASGSWREYITPSSNLSTGTWYHFAAVFDDNANRYKVYVNGTQVLDSANTWATEPDTTDLYIGSASFGQYFSGRLDELRIYNRALSAAEVQALAAQ